MFVIYKMDPATTKILGDNFDRNKPTAYFNAIRGLFCSKLGNSYLYTEEMSRTNPETIETLTNLTNQGWQVLVYYIGKTPPKVQTLDRIQYELSFVPKIFYVKAINRREFVKKYKSNHGASFLCGHGLKGGVKHLPRAYQENKFDANIGKHLGVAMYAPYEIFPSFNIPLINLGTGKFPQNAIFLIFGYYEFAYDRFMEEFETIASRNQILKNADHYTSFMSFENLDNGRPAVIRKVFMKDDLRSEFPLGILNPKYKLRVVPLFSYIIGKTGAFKGNKYDIKKTLKRQYTNMPIRVG